MASLPWWVSAPLFGEIVATVLLLGIALGVQFAPFPPSISFTERDPAMSYQLTQPESVSTTQLGLIAILAPVLVIALASLWLRYATSRSNVTVWVHVVHFGALVLSFAQAMLICQVLTQSIKLGVSRQRPNFFALCNYKGYRSAVQSGNFSDYWAATTPGLFGDVAHCAAIASEIRDSQSSFPSGHASTSACGMVFLTLFLRALFAVPRRAHVTVLTLLAAAPLIVAIYISTTRVRDRWHDTTDISCGAAIGVLSAWLAWTHYGSAPQRTLFEMVASAGGAASHVVASSVVAAPRDGEQPGYQHLSSSPAHHDDTAAAANSSRSVVVLPNVGASSKK